MVRVAADCNVFLYVALSAAAAARLRIVNVKILKLGDTYYQFARMEAELSDSVVKDTFLPVLRIIIYVLEFSVEGIFNHIVIFFHRGVNTNKTDVAEFYPGADCDYSFVHMCEPRDKVAKSLTNYEFASKFVLINMAAVIDIARSQSFITCEVL